MPSTKRAQVVLPEDLVREIDKIARFRVRLSARKSADTMGQEKIK
jgi:hypothetical protein